jgi:hypothetical protein
MESAQTVATNIATKVLIVEDNRFSSTPSGIQGSTAANK